MAKIRLIVPSLMLLLMFLLPGCSDSKSSGEKPVFGQVPEIAEIKPQKPVKIKLKRSTGGNYSWDLRGDDAEKILEVDRKLKRALEGKE